MAWHDDGKRIAAVRETDRARCARLADAAREFAVAQRLAVRDRAERGPHLALEGSAFGSERQVELRALAGEVFGQLHARRCERRVIPSPRFRAPPLAAMALHPDTRDRFAVPGEQQLPDRTVEQAEDRCHRCLHSQPPADISVHRWIAAYARHGCHFWACSTT